MARRWRPAVAAIGVLAGCGAVAAATDGQGPKPSTVQAASGTGFLLRPALQAQGCTPPRQIEDRPAPAAVSATLSVLRLHRTSLDGLPVLNRADGRSSADDGWLPVRTFDARGLRRRPGSTPAIYVVPSAGVLRLDAARVGAPCPSALNAPAAAGACLVTGPPGGPLAVDCWTLQEIERGRALALIQQRGTRELVGLAPSGATDTLTGNDGSRIAIRTVDGVISQRTRLPLDGRVQARITP